MIEKLVVAKKVKDADGVILNSRNGTNHNKQNNSKKVKQSRGLKDKIVLLKSGNPSVGKINKDYKTGALEQQENQTRRNSSSNEVRETKMNKNLKVTTKSKDINVVIGNLRNSNSTKQNDFTKVNETLNFCSSLFLEHRY